MVQLELASPFDLFGVFVIEVAEEDLTAPAPEIIEDAIAIVNLFMALLRKRPTLWTHLFHSMFYWDLSPVMTMFLTLHLWI